MSRATRKLPVAACAVIGALALASSASALDPEGAAKAALKRASEKYLATDFTAAMAILKKAAKGCGSTRCSTGTRAALLRDIGVMQFRAGDKAAAQKSFADALALDPSLALNADYDAPDVRAAFNAAKPGGGKSEGGGGEAPAATGDFSHTPATEQKVNTPLPVYAEISGGGIRRVAVRYKGASMSDWARVEMKRVGDGWGATIPCGAVTVGTMRYWIQGFDADGNSAASSGDAKQPFEVPIREDITSEAPHLPGRPAPESCEEGEEGEQRHAEHEEEPAESGEHEKRPLPASSAYARWWIGVAGAIDFLSLPAAADACALNSSSAAPLNSAGYYCTNPDGSDFPTRANPAQNASLIPNAAGTVGGGVHPGDLRALFTVDYALSPGILVGARLGYVLNSYPTSGQAVHDKQAFGSNVHFEVRGTYVFGDAPLTHEGFAPTVFVAAGVAPFDGHVTSVVSMNVKGPMGSMAVVNQPVNVWLANGPWFLALGGGARYQLSPRAAFNAVVRANAAFGGSGALFTFGPEIGFQYGF